jgi:hypothetical protein
MLACRSELLADVRTIAGEPLSRGDCCGGRWTIGASEAVADDGVIVPIDDPPALARRSAFHRPSSV